MIRTLLVAALAATAATAAPVPKAPPPPNPKTAASLQLASAKMSGQYIQLTQTVDVVQHIAVTETINQNGQDVTITKVVPQVKQVQQVYNMTVKGIKATTAEGKEISEEDLVKKLADATAVVQAPAGFDAEWKKLFADDVIFLEPTNVGVGKPGVIIRPGGPNIQPVPLPIGPGGGNVVPVPIIIRGGAVEVVPAPLPVEKK